MLRILYCNKNRIPLLFLHSLLRMIPPKRTIRCLSNSKKINEFQRRGNVDGKFTFFYTNKITTYSFGGIWRNFIIWKQRKLCKIYIMISLIYIWTYSWINFCMIFQHVLDIFTCIFVLSSIYGELLIEGIFKPMHILL